MIPVLNTIDAFLNALENRPVDWDLKPDADRWSAKEIIGHLCDSAQINLQRFIRCTYEENFKLIYHQNEWVAVQHYQDMDAQDIISLWKALNGQIQRVLDNYPTDRWQTKCDNGGMT